MSSTQDKQCLKINRLEALIDGVFAIAMTILVLGIEVPRDTTLSGLNLHKAILNQSGEIVAYIISFLMLALFWTINHKQFNSLVKTDNNHVRINMFILIFICLVPYTASLKGNYPNDWMSNLYFNTNMLIISVMFFINWNYATKNNRLTKADFLPSQRQNGIARNIVFMIVALLASCSSFYLKDNSAYFYLLIPLFNIGYEKLQKAEVGKSRKSPDTNSIFNK